MIENPKEVRLGNGGHIVDQEGDVLPIQDGFSFQDELDLGLEGKSANTPEQASPEKKAKTPETSQQQRLRTAYELHRFLPRSAEELGHIVGIDRFNGNPSSYLGGIMHHQHSVGHGDKTFEIALSVAEDFKSYLKDAEPVRFYLHDVKIDVQEAVTLGDRQIESFAKLVGGQGRALAQIVRRDDMLKFLSGDATNRKYTFNENIFYRDQLPKFLSEHTLKELLELFVQTEAEEQNRLNYWMKQIEDSQNRVSVLGSEVARRIIKS